MKWIYLSMILLLAACVPVTGEEPVEPAPEINLEGTQWMLESINETPVVPGSDVTLQFDADNTAGGHAGCNSYGGTYALNNGDIVFSDIIRTLVACVDENIMDQEDDLPAGSGERGSGNSGWRSPDDHLQWRTVEFCSRTTVNQVR
jgi:heat shock protein HslJ